MDIRYIYSEWQEQLDALGELISGLNSLRDSLQAADSSLGDIDRCTLVKPKGLMDFIVQNGKKIDN